MKLWRRRPLSEDFSRKEINLPDEMPPTLVYISPGNHGIFKRSSFINKELSDKFQLQTDQSCFKKLATESQIPNKTNVGNNRFQSFRDYDSRSSVKFDENTLKSINKDCKSYLPPVSLEWSPVKDVMKICRSASVPFHTRNSPRVDTPETDLMDTNIVKTPHLSLSEKIKTFFRNRSASRSSKQVLMSITENKPPKPANCVEKRPNRSSRSRMKDTERCKSLYEPSRALNSEYCQKLNNVISTNGVQTDLNKNVSPKQMLPIKVKKIEEKSHQVIRKDKNDRKNHAMPDNQKRIIKTHSLNQESPQKVILRGFSSSVVSHTTSSAAKCKTNSPKTPESDHRNNRHCDRRCIKKPVDHTTPNFNKKIPTPYDCPDFVKFDSPMSYKPPQAMIAPKSDRKIVSLRKSDAPTLRFARYDSKECKQKNEYLLPNRVIIPVLNNIENRVSATTEKRKFYNGSNVDDDDDYVTLAEMGLQQQQMLNTASMTQSLYVPVLPDYTNVKEKYDNLEIQQINHRKNQSKDIIILKNKPRAVPVGGELRKRPISCMAVVNADVKIPATDGEICDQQAIVYPKSPYLSQYSKLYSLRTNDIELVNRYGTEMTDTDIMTRSQHSGHYKLPSMISKDQTGKLSIDSGLVDDINASHSDSVHQIQNY